MKKEKYTKESSYYSEVVTYFKNTTHSLLEVSRETKIPYHGVRKLYKIYKGRKQ